MLVSKSGNSILTLSSVAATSVAMTVAAGVCEAEAVAAGVAVAFFSISDMSGVADS